MKTQFPLISFGFNQCCCLQLEYLCNTWTTWALCASKSRFLNEKQFLVADTQLYKRLRPSVRPLVRPGSSSWKVGKPTFPPLPTRPQLVLAVYPALFLYLNMKFYEFIQFFYLSEFHCCKHVQNNFFSHLFPMNFSATHNLLHRHGKIDRSLFSYETFPNEFDQEHVHLPDGFIHGQHNAGIVGHDKSNDEESLTLFARFFK